MTLYIISYDLIAPGQNYAKLAEAIKTISGDWAKPLESVWLVPSTLTAAEIRDQLKTHLDANDKLIVMTTSTAGWAMTKIVPKVTDWLRAK